MRWSYIGFDYLLLLTYLHQAHAKRNTVDIQLIKFIYICSLGREFNRNRLLENQYKSYTPIYILGIRTLTEISSTNRSWPGLTKSYITRLGTIDIPDR